MTSFDVSPYYDDFDAPNGAKNNNYMRIMFKPGYAVQARELTQIQSIIQNQIQSFGDNIFQNGSPISGGHLTYNNKVTSIQLQTHFGNTAITLDNFKGQLISTPVGEGPQIIRAKVIAVDDSLYGSGNNTVGALVVKYLTGIEFADGTNVQSISTSLNQVIETGTLITDGSPTSNIATTTGSIVSINEGIFYVDGFFVYVEPQTIVLDSLSTTPTFSVGLEIHQSIVNYTQDTALLDPAQGSFNYQAPGADRFQFGLKLSKRALNSIDTSQFFELLRVENGVITSQIDYTQYNQILRPLAEAVYDQSGDFTVNPFIVSASDNPNDANTFLLNISPGKAYIKGYEFETTGKISIVDEKALTTNTSNSHSLTLDYGNYVIVDNVYSGSDGFFDIANFASVDLHCVPTANINTTSFAVYSNTVIGNARLRDLEYAGDRAYYSYLLDINVAPVIANAGGTSANSTYITLPADFSDAGNSYVNVSISIIAGNSSGDLRTVVSHDPFNNLIVDVPFSEIPDTSTVFSLNFGVKDLESIVAKPAGASSIITNVAQVGTVATITTSKNSRFSVGDPVTISGLAQTSLNGTWTITSVNTDTFTFSLASNTITSQADSGTAIYVGDFGADNLYVMQYATTVPKYASMDISKLGQSTTANTLLYESSRNTLVYTLPNSYIAQESIVNVSYYNRRILQSQSFGSGTITLTGGGFGVLNAGESFPYGFTGAIDPIIANENITVIVDSIATGPDGGIANGVALVFDSDAGIAGGSGNSVIQTSPTSISIFSNTATSFIADILYTVKTDSGEINTRRSKVLIPAGTPNTSLIVTDVPTNGTSVIGASDVSIDAANGYVWFSDVTRIAKIPGTAVSLYTPDVVSIVKILDSGNTDYPPSYTNAASDIDITSSFILDSGQRNNYYDHAALYLKNGYAAPQGQTVVMLAYYNHDTLAGFFDANSYSSDVYSTGKIPYYNSSDLGIISLRDSIDFRPTRANGTSSDVSRFTFSSYQIPQPYNPMILSYGYYLPRIDKLVLTRDKQFKVISGVPSLTPFAPPDSDDSMTLYAVGVPAYTYTSEDVKLNYYNNLRYTMKDIGKIDQKVKTLQYQAVLTASQQKAVKQSVTYQDGSTVKSVYGAISDSFSDSSIADSSNPDFNCAISANTLTPYIITTPIQFNMISSSGPFSQDQTDKTTCMAYTEEPCITQNTATDFTSIQPFAFGQFLGELTLIPETDFWYNQTTSYTEIVPTANVAKVANTATVTAHAPHTTYFVGGGLQGWGYYHSIGYTVVDDSLLFPGYPPNIVFGTRSGSLTLTDVSTGDILINPDTGFPPGALTQSAYDWGGGSSFVHQIGNSGIGSPVDWTSGSATGGAVDAVSHG
jgi:hypothetical protein